MRTWAMANCICEKHGARLCTKDELERNCAEKVGCNHDHDLVWSSTPEPTASPTTSAAPSTVMHKYVEEQCEAETANFYTENKYWANCGSSIQNRCPFEDDGVFEADTLHEVRCCADEYIAGFRQIEAQLNCGIWARSRLLGQCYNMRTWAMANCICGKYGARLCRKEELENNCADNA